MKFTQKVRFLGAIAKPYDFEGRQGTSYKARVLFEDEIYPCRLEKDVYAKISETEKGDFEATFEVRSVSGVTTLWLVELE